VTPSLKIPTVELPVAEPWQEAALAAVPVPLVQDEYVYLFRVVEDTQDATPKANIPFVQFPAAAPK